MPHVKPFVLNVDTKIAHRRPTHEECNVDQIVRRRNASLLPQNYRKCAHCFGQVIEPEDERTEIE